MDYDRYDAILHWLFRHTQVDTWLRPKEESITGGVALRVSDAASPGPPEFRVFPYEDVSLEPFETAIAALNPAVAVKIRNASVHAVLAEAGPEDLNICVDTDARIQILDTMFQLSQVNREQCAAFVRDERVLVIWSESLERIIPIWNDFEIRLMKFLRAPPGLKLANCSDRPLAVDVSSVESGIPRPSWGKYEFDEKANSSSGGESKSTSEVVKTKRSWYGKKIEVIEPSIDLEAHLPEERKIKMYSPLYVGLGGGLAFVFVGNGVRMLLVEADLDGSYTRFALLVTIPFLYCISLFFALQLIQNITIAVGPIAHMHENSKYYSAVKPPPNKEVDLNLPHITIQMPVYKESLEAVLAPSIEFLKKAMQTYARQGGSSNIFVNDDGLRLISPQERNDRLAFYANHNIGWVARPKHDSSPEGFKRAGRFKKASNMNYGLALSLKAEKHLEALLANPTASGQATSGSVSSRPQSARNNTQVSSAPMTQYGMQYQNREGDESVVWGTASGGDPGEQANVGYKNDEDLEEKALAMAIEEVWEESGRKFRPWAANGKAIRVGEIVLIVDSDTVVPEDCFRDAAREMNESPTVAIIQHCSDVMQVAHHYFENGITYFTRRINKSISVACANGEVAPFMGHNAFLRWRAIQDAAFEDPADGQTKIWSESNVSEDFDMALRLLLKGYILRWATYSNGGFKEGVSLTVDDELNRWQKYAYGCNELLFNPLVEWFKKGPIAHQIHRFLWSNTPLHSKISMMSYMFSYYGIAAGLAMSLMNYILLGFQLPIDGYFMHSFEIWMAIMFVFWGTGTVGFTLLEYRLGEKSLHRAFGENLKWLPFFFFFFGGLSIPLSQALLAHLFSYDIQWSATVKELRRSNFFEEIPKIGKRFWFPLLASFTIVAGMVICSTPLVPYHLRINGEAWAVIFPLSLTVGCHILFPIVLNPWLMVFSY